MLQVLETAKAKLLALEAEGVAKVREIIEHIEEAIGMHKAAAEEPAPSIPGIEVTEGAPADAAPSSTDPAPAA